MESNSKSDLPQNNKLLKKKRVMRYFIDAARDIAKESGLGGVTIRSVAERAGYNSATLYNYFENLNQLMAFTSIDLVSDWLHGLTLILAGDGDELDKYIRGWRIFCECSFKDPTGFTYIYSSSDPDQVVRYFEEYFEAFPEPSQDIPKDVLDLYKMKTLQEQEILMIGPSVKAGFFIEKDSEDIYKLALLLYNGLVWTATQPGNTKTPEELTRTFLKYFAEYIQFKLKRDKDLSEYLDY